MGKPKPITCKYIFDLLSQTSFHFIIWLQNTFLPIKSWIIIFIVKKMTPHWEKTHIVKMNLYFPTAKITFSFFIDLCFLGNPFYPVVFRSINKYIKTIIFKLGYWNKLFYLFYFLESFVLWHLSIFLSRIICFMAFSIYLNLIIHYNVYFLFLYKYTIYQKLSIA